MTPAKRPRPRPHPASTAAQTGFLGGTVLGTVAQLAQGWEILPPAGYVAACLAVGLLCLIGVERLAVYLDDQGARRDASDRIDSKVLAERLRKLPPTDTRRTRRG